MVLPEEGLATYCNDGDDLMMALARKIVSGNEEEDEAETVEEVFAQARDAEASAEEYLVDDDWNAVEIEPEAGNGHHDDGIEPTGRAHPGQRPPARERQRAPRRGLGAAAVALLLG